MLNMTAVIPSVRQTIHDLISYCFQYMAGCSLKIASASMPPKFGTSRGQPH